MDENTLIRKMSLPMRWLALAAAVEVGLVVLAAAAVQSEPILASNGGPASGPLGAYANAASKAITAVLPAPNRP